MKNNPSIEGDLVARVHLFQFVRCSSLLLRRFILKFVHEQVEARVAGDEREPRGATGRRKKSLLSPSRPPLRANSHRESDVWERGRRCLVYKITKKSVVLNDADVIR